VKIGSDHRLPRQPTCPSCGKLLDGAAGVATDARPEPGDVSVCVYCGHLMAFADDLTLRELTAAEMHEIAGDERILAVQRARAQMETPSFTCPKCGMRSYNPNDVRERYCGNCHLFIDEEE
jgi:transcription elongation factor Elf1